MLWTTAMKKVSKARESRKSLKEMGAFSIVSIGKMKNHLRRLSPKYGRATNHVLISYQQMVGCPIGDVLGNDLKSALMHGVSFSSQNQ